MERSEDVELYTVEIGEAISVETEIEDDGRGQHNYSHQFENAHDQKMMYEYQYQEQPQQHQNYSNAPSRQHRGPNFQHKFTAREKWLLVEMVDNCKFLLLSKSAKTEIRRRKMQLWSDITNEINMQCGRNRTVEHMKKLWDYLASRARKAMNDRENGVDPDTIGYISFNPLLEKVAIILYGEDHPILVNVHFNQQQQYIEYQEEEKFDFNRSFPPPNNSNRLEGGEEYDDQPKTAIEVMRRLLLNTAPVKPKNMANVEEHHYFHVNHVTPYEEHGHRDQGTGQQDQPFIALTSETTYDDLVHCIIERDQAQKRMLEARRTMLEIKTSVDQAKEQKKMEESQNYSLETLKWRHLLGDLDPRNASKPPPTPFDPNSMSDEEEAPEDQENEL